MTRTAAFGVAAFAALALAYVLLFAYHAPYFDHWDLAKLLEAADAGQLTLAGLFEIHGGHWHASAYALAVPLAQATGWSHLAEALVSLTFIAGTAAILLKLGARFATVANAPSTMIVIVTAALLFSLDQASNLLWGFQLCVFVSQFGALAAIACVCAQRFGAPHFVGAVAGLVLSISAYATGFAVAPIVLVLLALRDDLSRTTRISYGTLWALICAATIVAFVHAQAAAPGAAGGNPEPLGPLALLAHLVVFELNFIGGGVSRFASDLAIPVALLALALAGASALMLRRRGVALKALLIPLALCAFGLGAGALIGLGRAGFGAEQALNSRYVSFSTPFWIGAAWLMLAALRKIEGIVWKRALAGALIFLALLKTGNCVQAGTKSARLSHEIAIVAADMRAHPERAAIIARAISAETQNIPPHVAFIERKHWSAFRD